MQSQFTDTMINTLVQKLNSAGININLETVKKAIANNPQIVQKVEEFLASGAQDKKAKILELLRSAAGLETTTGGGTGGSTTGGSKF